MHAVDRAIDLDQRVDEWLSALPGGFDRQLFSALLHDGRRAPQDLDSTRGAEPPIPVTEEFVGRVQRLLNGLRASALHSRNQALIIRRMDIHTFAVRRGTWNHEWELLRHFLAPPRLGGIRMWGTQAPA